MNLNPVFIVADYEVRTGGEDETAAGVRVATKLAADKLELGASAVFQGAQAGDTQHRRQRPHLAPLGRDASARRSRAVAVGRSAASGFVHGLAGRGQTRLRASRGARLGARDRAPASASISSSPPTPARAARGVDARYKFTESVMVSGEVQHQDVLASDAIAAAGERRRAHVSKDDYSVGGGVRHVADEDASGDERVSDQAFVTGSVDFWDGRVTLRGAQDATPRRQGRERRLSGAQPDRRRLPPERRHDAVRGIRTRRRRRDRQPTSRASACARVPGSARR